MKYILIAIALAGCAQVPATNDECISPEALELMRDQRDAFANKLDMLTEEASKCGRFDTTKLRQDLEHPLRTDQLWYETVIKRMAIHLDCEQGD